MDTCCIQTPLYRKDRKKCCFRVHIKQNITAIFFLYLQMNFSIIYLEMHLFIYVECWDRNKRLTSLRSLPTFLGPQGVLSAAMTP